MNEMVERNEDTLLLLRRCNAGDDAAYGLLFERIYADLRRRARHVRRGSGSSFSTTALVHETYLNLAGTRLTLNDKAHFFRLAARAMRHVLIDAVRREHAQKRGGGEQLVTFDAGRIAAPAPDAELLALDRSLEALAVEEPRMAQVVELHFFAGLPFAEIGVLLSLSERTVARDWRAARALLSLALAEPASPAAPS